MPSKNLLIMELRFDAMMCSNLGNKNSDANQGIALRKEMWERTHDISTSL